MYKCVCLKGQPAPLSAHMFYPWSKREILHSAKDGYVINIKISLIASEHVRLRAEIDAAVGAGENKGCRGRGG